MNNTGGSNNKNLNVYVLTRTGSILTEKGCKVARDLVMGELEGDPSMTPELRAKIKSGLPAGIKDATVQHGFDLDDPGFLADLLERDPDARVVISFIDGFAVCPYGSGENGLGLVIERLRNAAKRGITSWEALNGG